MIVPKSHRRLLNPTSVDVGASRPTAPGLFGLCNTPIPLAVKWDFVLIGLVFVAVLDSYRRNGHPDRIAIVAKPDLVLQSDSG